MKVKYLFIFLLSIFPVKAEIKVYETTLENGLRIIIVPMQSNNIIKFGILYKVGTADDPMCKIGLSHFLEHMMFRGTKKISGDKLKYIVDKYNIYTNAYTTSDYTVYYYSVQKDFLDVDLRIESDRMQNLKISEKDLETERAVVMDERNLRCDSDPETRYLGDALQRIKYIHSNYGFNGIGYPHQIKNYSKKALQKHYKKFYQPNNAIIIIVGDITPEEAIKKVKAAFKDIKRGETVIRNRVIDPPDLNMRYSIERFSNQIKRSYLGITYTFDRKYVDSFKKWCIAFILNKCLGERENSVFHKKLVEETEAVYSVNSFLEILSFDKCFLYIILYMRAGTKPKDIELQTLKIVEKFVSNYLTKALFDSMKNSILNDKELLLDSPASMFNYIVELVGKLGFSLEEIKNATKILQEITFEEVKQLAQELLLEKNKSHVLFVHPESIENVVHS